MSKHSFAVHDGEFFGMFDFVHTEDEADDHLLIFETCELKKDIKLDDGTILAKGRKFDAIWWNLKACTFQFIDWVPKGPNHSVPKCELKCTQALLMEQGWWANNEVQKAVVG